MIVDTFPSSSRVPTMALFPTPLHPKVLFINLRIYFWHLLCCSPFHSDSTEFWTPTMLCFSLYPLPCFHMLPWHKCSSPVFDPTDQWLFICQWSCLCSSSHVQWHDTWQYYPSFFQISCQNLFLSKTTTDILKPEWPKWPFGWENCNHVFFPSAARKKKKIHPVKEKETVIVLPSVP